ncbi:MAG: nucleoside deaminase [Candidatus Cloacimonetes bacterium]|nr:nucleoside deaminase [Candidatus Cloacimonadota bacterium]
MRIALIEASRAAKLDEIPVGAVLIDEQNIIIAQAANQTRHNQNPLGHAEKIVIEKALADGKKFLYNYTLYVTLEPCIMCAGLIVLSRIGRLVYGANDPKAGAAGSLYHIPKDKRLNHNPQVTAGILEEECSQILKDYFNSKR